MTDNPETAGPSSNQTRAAKPKSTKTTRPVQLHKLHGRKNGATIAQIQKTFGWQRHTTRAAISRLRKSGYEISSMKTRAGKRPKYHITGVPPENNTQ